MKILKIFGVVVGIHVFALLLIFANPGCSSTSKPPPAPIDTVVKSTPAPGITVPTAAPGVTVPTGESTPITVAPISFNPDAPATAGAPGGGSRYSPTRPNTAAASALVVEPVTEVTPATTYTVKAGDSLWSIATKNHLTVAELAAQNGLKAGAILQPGTKLVIPGKKPAAATPPAATAPTTAAPGPGKPALPKPTPGESLKHTVRAGESLSTIARAYDVKQGDIAVANNLTDPSKIRAGIVLTIPGGWQAPGAKAAKAAGAKSGSAAAGAKAAGEPAKPLFNPLGAPAEADSPIKTAPPPAGAAVEVPVIKIEDAPPKKP